MKKWCLLLTAGLALVGGCNHAFPVNASGDFEVGGFLRTSNEVIVVNPPPESQPVVPVPLVGCVTCEEVPRIAVVELDGILVNKVTAELSGSSENPIGLFREKLAAIEADPMVRAVVVRINSVGGSVAATDMLHRELSAFKERTHLPVVACLMDYGTGGGYYVACAADQIVAHPTTVTGGIGVMLNLYNLNGVMGQLSVVPQPIKAGENIDMGSAQGALMGKPEEMLQAMADGYHARFKDVVRKSRPAVNEQKGRTFDGRVFAAKQAQELGLLDSVGYVEDAVHMAAAAGFAEGAVPVLYRRAGQAAARSLYSTTADISGSGELNLLPDFPGLRDNSAPVFMYAWHPQLIMPKAQN